MKDMDFLINQGVDVNSSLETFGDINTYNDLLKDFEEEVDNKLNEIKKFKESADMANYAILAHSLKSDAKCFGFTNLAEQSYQHEIQSKANNIYFVTENFDNLMKEAISVISIVRQYLGEENVREIINTRSVDKNKTLLVVDDSNIIRNYVQTIFNDMFKIVVAKDGLEALENIEKEANIIGLLLDLNMPNVDGFAVLDYFKAKNLFDKISVFIITGENDEAILQKAKSYPIIDVLEKPFNERDIRKVVEKTLELS